MTMSSEKYEAVRPRRKPLRMTRARRERVEAIVDTLIILLDELEGDPDLEDGGDDEPDADIEPSIGVLHYVGFGKSEVDLEGGDEHDGREPDADDEHDIGWQNQGDQSRLGMCGGAEADLATTEYEDRSGVHASQSGVWCAGAEGEDDEDLEPDDDLEDDGRGPRVTDLPIPVVDVADEERRVRMVQP